MNIAIFTNNYLPNPYGVSGSIESFRKQFEKRGHIVYVFAPEVKNYIDENPRVFRYPSFDIKYRIRFPLPVPYGNKIEKIIKKLDIDVIHSQHPNLLGFSAKRWARKKRIPLVFTWHTLYNHYVNYVPLVPKKIAGKLAIKQAVRYANQTSKIIVPTPTVEKIIKKWGVRNNNIAVIPTGVNMELFQDANRKLIRDKYGIGENEILLLLVSRLTEEKNVLFLLSTVLRILNTNKKVKFLIVGDGYLKTEMKKNIADNNLLDQIFFAGLVAPKEMKNYYASADIFVYSSKSETQGMIITEAMASGLPIVAVQATGVCDLVVNNESGFLVRENKKEFINAVNKLIDSQKMRLTFGKKAKEISRQKYTAEICANQMLKIYKELII